MVPLVIPIRQASTLVVVTHKTPNDIVMVALEVLILAVIDCEDGPPTSACLVLVEDAASAGYSEAGHFATAPVRQSYALSHFDTVASSQCVRVRGKCLGFITAVTFVNPDCDANKFDTLVACLVRFLTLGAVHSRTKCI